MISPTIPKHIAPREGLLLLLDKRDIFLRRVSAACNAPLPSIYGRFQGVHALNLLWRRFNLFLPIWGSPRKLTKEVLPTLKFCVVSTAKHELNFFFMLLKIFAYYSYAVNVGIAVWCSDLPSDKLAVTISQKTLYELPPPPRCTTASSRWPGFICWRR